jgi:hypothetical protein
MYLSIFKIFKTKMGTIDVVDHSRATGHALLVFRSSFSPHRTHPIVGVLRFIRARLISFEFFTQSLFLFLQIVLSSHSLFLLILLNDLACID